jgi:UDP-N-acetyl-D-galactosamine dehydrogenase
MSASLSGRWYKNTQEYGYHPEIILAGRHLNDNMGKYVASEVFKSS